MDCPSPCFKCREGTNPFAYLTSYKGQNWEGEAQVKVICRRKERPSNPPKSAFSSRRPRQVSVAEEARDSELSKSSGPLTLRFHRQGFIQCCRGDSWPQHAVHCIFKYIKFSSFHHPSPRQVRHHRGRRRVASGRPVAAAAVPVAAAHGHLLRRDRGAVAALAGGPPARRRRRRH